jgi:diguanylate cyclase (GGDEF)-like protein
MDEDLILLGMDYARIQSAWDAVLASGAEDQAVSELAQASHRLAGAALSIGYTDIGNAARNLETALRSAATPPDLSLWKNSLDTLARACTDHKLDELYHKQMLENTQSASINQTSSSNTRIYLIDDDLTQAQLLAAQVSRFGYQVQVFDQLADLPDQLRNGIPKAVLMDIVFPEGELAGAEEIRGLQAEFNNQIPVFFISVRDDTAARIQAIRAGGIGYFTKPVDIDALMDEINKLDVHEDPQPYRVMIVDDSEVQAKTSAMHLKKVGMETCIVFRSAEVLDMLEDFRPDIVLLDLYMPDYTGLEIAQMIRQIKAYVGLPIVYLSAESDREKQLSAVGQGGDDFLTKPIKPDTLIEAVTARIERYRQLQTLMLRDGLTGLFNHTTMREHLVQEINRAARNAQPFSLAMLDIDKFKDVNDRYGHATGDKVLRSLAQMLTLRLRRADIIGRYGGEEFVIILPNTEVREAVGLLDDLRNSFSQIVHLAQKAEFQVTFSCGISGFPQFDSAASLSEAADKALYIAKHQGRNQVVRQ